MSANVTGARYVEAIRARDSDRRARDAFQALAVRLVKPAGRIFDFGSGPGIDARCYAERGFTVGAYDVDPQMRAHFEQYCRDDMIKGRITLDGGSYEEFLAAPRVNAGRRVDLITANFAPLNLVSDLTALFAKFHTLAAPEGVVLAAVLNPYFIGDLRYGWWWRNAPRLWRSGEFSVPGAQAPIVRRRLARYAAQCGPHFYLEHVFRGLPARAPPESAGFDVRDGVDGIWRHLTTCRFMFLKFVHATHAVAAQAASPHNVA
jgi:SAM-dependent methyltransferase